MANSATTVTPTKKKLKPALPPRYQVILLNDDFTPMDFVVEVLMRYFSKSAYDASRIMLDVHHNGKGVCGIYTKDIAATKVAMVLQFAHENQHPLLCTMEQVPE